MGPAVRAEGAAVTPTGPTVSLAALAAVPDAVRLARPVVHCLTATVSMALVADGLLAAGARPMMTETAAEAPVVVEAAEALLVNLGTLSTDGAAGIPHTVTAARALDIPWVLDPTAIGRAPVRTALASDLIGQDPAVVRGNPSEIGVLAGGGTGGRGADATVDVDAVAVAAAALARDWHTVVAVSGASDLITDGDRVCRVDNGVPVLQQVTGTGCLLGALTAACLRVAEPFVASAAATLWLTVAAERAEAGSAGPGSFKIALLDQLAAVGAAELAAAGRLR